MEKGDDRNSLVRECTPLRQMKTLQNPHKNRKGAKRAFRAQPVCATYPTWKR